MNKSGKLVTPVNADGTPNGFVANGPLNGKGGNLVTLVDDNGNPITIGGNPGTSGVTTVNTQAGNVVGTYKTVGTLQAQFDDIGFDTATTNSNVSAIETNITEIEADAVLLENQVIANTTDISTNTTDISTINNNLKLAVSQFVATTPAPLGITANANIDISNIITSGTFVETQTGTDIHVFGDTVKKSIKPNKTGWYQLNIMFTLTGGALNDFNASLKLFASTNGTTWATEIPFTFRNQGLTADMTTLGAGNVTFSTNFYFNATGANGANILAHGVKAIAQISDSGTVQDLKLQIGRI